MLIGLTGGIGSGKSCAADYLATLGIEVVDADLASRAVVEPGQPALAAITERFGDDILLADKSLDRAALRQRIFAATAERKWLQQLLHPLINAYLKQQIEATKSVYCILVNPLLIESGQATFCDKVIVVDVPVSTQISRTMARDNNTKELVESIIQAQIDRESRLEAADFVVDNDQNLDHLYKQLDVLHTRLQQLCQTQPAS